MRFVYISKEFEKDYQVNFGILRKFDMAAVISSKDCYFFRKVYPKVDIKDLPNIVQNDNFDIKLDNPVIKYRLRDIIDSGYVVDIWIFDKNLIKGRKFKYIVPEHGMFFSNQTEITIYRDIQQDSLLNVVAHDYRGYISSIHLSSEDFKEEFNIFLRSVDRFGKVKKINLFVDISDIELEGDFEIDRIYIYDIPAFLIKTDLDIIKNFKEPISIGIDIPTVLRSSILFLLSVSAVNYINIKEYQREINKIQTKIDDVDMKIKELMSKYKSDEDSVKSANVISKLKKDLSIDTIVILETILKNLPENDYLVAYNQEDFKLRISVNSKEPAKTIKKLSSVEIFSNMKMVTSPIKQQNGSFNILLDIDLRNKDDGQI